MLIWDIEADGLLDTITKVHCLCIYNTVTKVKDRYNPSNILEGVKQLQQALNDGEYICGHNIINYDIPALEKIYPQYFAVTYNQQPQIIDTLVLARLIYANIDIYDLGLLRSGKLPKNLYKSQSLEAWGYRLGLLKGDYGKQEGAWETYTLEMADYCAQDVDVTTALLEKLTAKPYPEKAIRLEHDAAWLMAKQERNGFCFDYTKAIQLEMKLRARQAVLVADMTQKMPQIPDKIFIPKRDNKRLGYKAGVPVQKYKEFNPNSRQQLEYIIRTVYKYSPQLSTLYDVEEPDDAALNLAEQRLKIDEETFKYITQDKNAPEELRILAAVVAESLMITKRLGQLADGKNAWLKAYNKQTGCIHGRVITNGTVSGRASHSSPNVAQVPAVKAPYGVECRELFNAGEWHQAGIDASGLELRCLAHYMYPYDKGAYANTILTGDIHTLNQKNAGLPTRDNAKRFIYGFLYGAGDAKIGEIINAGAKEGRTIKRRFMKATPALAKLKAAIQDCLAEMDRGRVTHWKRRYIKGLDGRLLYVRSLHSALNLLLQSAGALICKKWIVRTEERLLQLGLKHSWQGDFVYMAWVHDEIQIACRTKEIAAIVVEQAQAAMRDTQEFFNFRMQLDTEGKIGKNWKECH